MCRRVDKQDLQQNNFMFDARKCLVDVDALKSFNLVNKFAKPVQQRS